VILSPTTAIAIAEVRIRSRRVSTLVVLLAIIAISWLMVPDPASGMTMMAINDARVIYDSQCLALAGSTLMSTLLSLAGFYLVRGRMRGDLVCGVSAALACAPISNLHFLIDRWLGALAYLALLAGLCMVSLFALHAVRSDSPILLHIYLEHFVLILAPEIVLVASLAILFEAWSPLMGKVGDVLYFMLWAVTLGLSGSVGSHVTASVPLALWSDFSGLGTVIYGLHHLVHTTRFSIGVASFDAGLAPVQIAGNFWTISMLLMRLICAVVALLPLALAQLLFHRFSPDRISSRLFRSHRSLLTILNGMLVPIARLARPLYASAMRGPGLVAGLLADTALLVSSNPISLPAMALALAAGATLPQSILPGVLTGVLAFWGILISDSAVRDFSAGIEPMTGYLPGGATRRYLRQLLSCWLFGFLMVLPIALRWLALQPLRCLALVTGLLALSAIANLLGRVTRTSRTFTALLLFAIYVSTQIHSVPAFDTVGILGVATIESTIVVSLIGAAAVLAGLMLASGRRLAAG
jgi:hypothetical protein